MPIPSLLADGDDEFLHRAAPSDVDAAFTYLLSTFPFQPPSPHYLEPRTLLVSQLYSLVSDRTAVDREVDRRRRANEVRVMRCAQLGVDEYALITTDDYAAVVRSMWRATPEVGAKVAAGEQGKENADAAVERAASSAPLLAPSSQPIRRKRPRTETISTPPRAPLSPSARQPAAPSTLPPPIAPAMSASSRSLTAPSASLFAASVASLSDEDKENALSGAMAKPTSPPARPATAPSRSASPRATDIQLLLHTLLDSFLPGYTDVSITRAELLSRLYDGLPYAQLTADDVLILLFQHQLIAHNSHSASVSSASAASTSYLLLLPHTAHLLRECLDARQHIARLIDKSRYKQLRKSELEGKVRLPCTERGVRWHMLEMLGCGRLLEVETTKGTVIRMNAEHKGRVRR